ncbi:MAG: hypothetical protein H0V76_12320 [Blastocatellia bacterium]|nr:hypothetical protein [Blastocatellia bacterium]
MPYPNTLNGERKTVAVVVPLSNRSHFTADEEISFRHLKNYLGAYDKYLVVPKSLKIERPGFKIKPFDDHFFGSIAAHTRMMLDPTFYEAFQDYEFILTYHLDALVFSDQLMEWCDRGYDFIGAPRLGQSDTPHVVGNGGFALRKVESLLKVLRSDEYAVDPSAFWESFSAGKSLSLQLANLPRKYLKRFRPLNNIRRDVAAYLREPFPCEDIFLSERATKYYPEFNFAPLEMAFRFAFDEVPRLCFEITGETLPFGCHAWHKQDRKFWEPFLLSES